jgi:hypothetical protein
MTNLEREAMGKECQIRLPGICNFDTATTVLCHARGAWHGAPVWIAKKVLTMGKPIHD